MTDMNNHQATPECRVQLRRFAWSMHVLFLLLFFSNFMRGKWNEPLVPEKAGLYTGIFLLTALILLSSLIGRPRSITITDTIVIRRYLMPDCVLNLPAQVYLGDDAVLIGRNSLEFSGIRKSDELILWLIAHDEASNLSILPLNPDRPKIVARLGWHRVRPYIPLAVCTVYAVLSGALELQLLPYGWDYVFVPLIVFSLWYLVNWWLDKLAKEKPMS